MPQVALKPKVVACFSVPHECNKFSKTQIPLHHIDSDSSAHLKFCDWSRQKAKCASFQTVVCHSPPGDRADKIRHLRFVLEKKFCSSGANKSLHN